MTLPSPLRSVVIPLFTAILALRAAAAPLVLSTRDADFELDDTGAFRALTLRAGGRNCLAPGQPAPLLTLRLDGQVLAPVARSWDDAAQRITLRFPAADARVVVAVTRKDSHLTFETVEVEPRDRVEWIVWGPFPTAIGETIGEVVGVVRDRDVAVGIQALNIKTLGGYPTRDDDLEADFGAEDTGHYPDLPAELRKDQQFRGDTARKTPFGSVIQAYCRNRARERVIANWGHERFVAPAFEDGGVVGSRIALFACPTARALETLGRIEVAEGLPHPLLDGVWAKISPKADASYLIVDFSEANLDRAVEMTRRAGLEYLYHSSPFETWGHFKLKPALFPNGRDSLKRCVERARASGVRIGFHTLSNFITPNDPYVTPVPDPRLARVGTGALAAAIDAAQAEIPIAEPGFFRKATDMNAVAIDGELVRYRAVSEAAPWRLLDCQRGAWGTRAAGHAAGTPVGRLMDHGYKVFLTDAALTREVARNLADLCNHAGTLQISLDGLEGAWSTGMGQYGRTLFAQSWYEALDPGLKGQINDASNPGHFNWHSYTRMNWGEPWYAGFRESQTLYRFKNQLHFARNYMPRMLGWFALRADTSLEDAEWLLARAAGFGAGFALAASLASTAQLEADPASADTAREFGALPAILEAIRQWETARQSDAFPAETRAALRDNTREFHLQAAGAGAWDLFEAHLARVGHDASQPGPTTIAFRQPHPAQPLQWVLRSTAKNPVDGVRLLLNDRPAVELGERPIPARGALVYRGGSHAVVCDAAWKEVARIPVDAGALAIAPDTALRVRLAASAQPEARLNLELRTLGNPTRIQAQTTPGPGPAPASASAPANPGDR